MERKSLFQLLFTAVLVIGAVSGLVLMRRNQDIREEAAPSTTVSMTSSITRPIVNQAFTINVNANPGTNQVIAAELFIRFDTRYFTVHDITLGNFLVGRVEEFSKEIDNVNGTIYYVVANHPTNRVPATTAGTVAVINLTPKLAVTNTSVTFDTVLTKMGAIGIDTGVNVIQSYNNLTLSLANPTFTPTPSLTFTPTPTATRTPTPTTTRTPTPTPTINLNPPLCGASTIPLNPGVAPLTVTLHGAGNAGSGTGFDGYRWDFENDGVWDTGILVNAVTHTYTLPGTYRPKFQVHGTNNVWSAVCSYPYNVVVLTPTSTPTSIPTVTFTPTFTPTLTHTPTPTCIIGSPVFNTANVLPANNSLFNSKTESLQLRASLSNLRACGTTTRLEFWFRLTSNPGNSQKVCEYINPSINTVYSCNVATQDSSSYTWTVNAFNQTSNSSITRIARVAIPGDCDVNGAVDIVDYGILFFNFAKPSFDERADIDSNGSVDIVDYSYLFYNFGESI